MKRVRLESIVKDYFSFRRGRVKALKGIDIDIEPAEFFVLLGPSGCGKSTLLNIIAGIEKQTSGKILFDDKLVADPDTKTFLSPKERDIAMVFQSYALYPHMTVYENIAFPLKISKMDKAEINEKVNSAAGILEIKDMLDAKPSELSGGQRQRVALGRAIVRKPSVLLLDEPLSNLDALLRITMRNELKQIQRELKLTTIYVTHDQIEAMSLGDRIAVLNSGRIEQISVPMGIYDEPESLFVAKFIGSPPMNLIDDKNLLSKFEFGIDHKDYTVGIRPENIEITSPDKGKAKGKLTMVSALGSEYLAYINIEGVEIIARSFDKINIKEGENVGINFHEKHLYLFDNKSGARIKTPVDS